MLEKKQFFQLLKFKYCFKKKDIPKIFDGMSVKICLNSN